MKSSIVVLLLLAASVLAGCAGHVSRSYAHTLRKKAANWPWKI